MQNNDSKCLFKAMLFHSEPDRVETEETRSYHGNREGMDGTR